MKKYPDPDAIRFEATALMTALAAMSFPGDDEFKLQSKWLSELLSSEQEYDYYEFCLEGTALLKNLLRIRMRMKITGQKPAFVTTLSAHIDTLRALLLENERYFSHLTEMNRNTASFFQCVITFTGTMVLLILQMLFI